MKANLFGAVFALALSSVCPAQASTITYTATGLISGVSPALVAQFSVGQAATYTFTYDTGVVDTDPSATSGFYPNALLSGAGLFGSYSFSTGLGFVAVNTAPGGGLIFWANFPTGDPVASLIPIFINLVSNDLSGTLFSSDSIPTLLDLSSFPSIPGIGQLRLYFGNGNPPGIHALYVELTALSETPLPAAFPLFVTGLGALGLIGWRRKRKQAAANV